MGAHSVGAARHPLFHPPIVRRAVREAWYKLSPRHMLRNPVMFVVLAGSALTTLVAARDVIGGRPGVGFTLQLALWLWFTVLFANFAEAMAEGRGKAQADALRGTRLETRAKRLDDPTDHLDFLSVFATELRRGDFVLVKTGDLIPADGEVIEGIASVDEAAITGESAPVIREAGGRPLGRDRGTRVLSDWLVIRVTADPGETFVDRMIALVEGASRRKTPNEVALTILLAGLTIVFLWTVTMLRPFAAYSGVELPVPVLVALLVCLIPTTIGGLLSAIGIAGMDRLVQRNVIAISGRAVEAAGDVDTLLLDKTGTITLGNRQAVAFVPAPGVAARDLADRAQLASLADETPEGRSIVVLAKEQYGLRGSAVGADVGPLMAFVPFSAATRMSGVNVAGAQIRKGAADAVARWLASSGDALPPETALAVEAIARRGGTPLLVAERRNGAALVYGAIHLTDTVKGGIRERFQELRRARDPDRDDHRGQRPDGRRDRCGGGGG